MVLTELDYAMCSHPGLVRKGNEDFCGASPADGVYVVCDGMGGAAAGEVASHLAVETFLRVVKADGVDPAERLRVATEAANEAVYLKARHSREFSGMGTTLIAAMVEAAEQAESGPVVGTLWLAHVGDSRCYRFRAGQIAQMTADHSIVEEQVQAGRMTRDEADQSPMRHVITRAVGSSDEVEVDVQPVEVCHGDLFVLASDGLNTDLREQEIAELLAEVATVEAPLEHACTMLIEAVNACGGHDNITVLLLRIH